MTSTMGSGQTGPVVPSVSIAQRLSRASRARGAAAACAAGGSHLCWLKRRGRPRDVHGEGGGLESIVLSRLALGRALLVEHVPLCMLDFTQVCPHFLFVQDSL